MSILEMDFERILGVPFLHSSSHSIMLWGWRKLPKVFEIASNQRIYSKKWWELWFVGRGCKNPNVLNSDRDGGTGKTGGSTSLPPQFWQIWKQQWQGQQATLLHATPDFHVFLHPWVMSVCFFRLLIKGILYPYVLWPFDKSLFPKSKLNYCS